MTLHTINPATGETIEEYRRMTDQEVDAVLEEVDAAQRRWGRTDLAHRAGLMKEAARLLRERKEEHATLMALEMGKPLAQGVAEAEKCAWVCDYYAQHAEGFLASETVETDARKSYVAFRPIGVVLAVMPWNFPYWQVFRFAAPTLMAGNGGVLKHASNVTGCALQIEAVFREAGFPPGIFRTILAGHDQVARAIEHPIVKAVTLTGSTEAGRSIAPRAGTRIKKSVLELGGSDPYLVLEDADLEATVSSCVVSRLINGGQSCIAAKRFLVVSEVAERFTEMFVEEMRSKRMADPMAEGTDLGPQARDDLRDELHSQVLRSLDAGARLLLGGEVPSRPGAWYPPTVLAGVTPEMPAFHEELFGPVAPIVTVADEAEAVRLANDTVFGLGAAVFTRDLERGERIAREELEAGSCFVNAFVKSDPRLPFGGIKESGYGRELALYGIREFVNVKTVYIA